MTSVIGVVMRYNVLGILSRTYHVMVCTHRETDKD